MENKELSKVIEFATKAHEGQKRRYTHEDYIIHPREVAIEVGKRKRFTNHLNGMVAAAFLHDVIEDTPVTFEELRKFLFSVYNPIAAGPIFETVVDLTDVYTKQDYPDWNRNIIQNQSKCTTLNFIRFSMLKH